MKVLNENTDRLIEYVFDVSHDKKPQELNQGKNQLSVYRVDNELVIFGLDKQGVKIDLASV